MSRTWNEEELKLASAEMKKMGYMTYEEFCEYLKTCPGYITEDSISENVIKKWKERQLQGEKMPCPRCGEDRMRTPVTHNALSRRADIYICEACGMEEAIYDAQGHNPLPFQYWYLYARLE